MRCDDFIPLARTVPEESKRYGARTCMAGYSLELGRPMRIYPVLIDAPIKTRHKHALELERNPDDNRVESYKLKDAEDSIRTFGAAPVVDTDGIFEIARATGLSSIGQLNAERKSLGFIEPTSARIELVAREGCQDPRNGVLFEEFLKDARKHEFVLGNSHDLLPYVTFRDASGPHSLQLREWGAFEFLRKNRDNPDSLLGAYRTGAEREILLLVGNMSHLRSVWMVLQVYSRKRQQQALLFDGVAA